MLKKIRHYLYITCLVLCTLIIAWQVIWICERKTSVERTQNFLENELDTDILFIGTSQIAADIVPMELWQRYGYTSYIMCAPKDGIKRNLGMLRLALEYVEPKLVVLNADRYWRENTVEEQVAGYHIFADAFPLSLKKIETTQAAFDDEEARKEIIFPFLAYHDRWKELSEGDFKSKEEFAHSLTKGGTEGDYVADYISRYEKISSEEWELPDGVGAKEIEEMIVECQNRDIDVLLVALPLEADAEQQRYFNGLQQIADRTQVSYLNLVANDTMLNPDTDYADGAHLNLSGARKMTKYIGTYIQENYEIPNRMLDEQYVQQWAEDYIQYCDYKNKRLQETDELHPILVLGGDENLNCVIYINEFSSVYHDEKTATLLKNLAPFAKLEQAIAEEKDFLAIVDYGNGEIHEFLDPEKVELETSFGTLRFCMDDSNKPDLRINDSGENVFVHDGRGDIAISFFDCLNKTNVCTKIFKTEQKLVTEPRIKE